MEGLFQSKKSTRQYTKEETAKKVIHQEKESCLLEPVVEKYMETMRNWQHQ